METLATSKYRALPWRHSFPSPARVRMDVWWGSERIYCEKPRCKSTRPGRCPSRYISSDVHPHQISDVAQALRFLHSQDIVHGSIMGVRHFSQPFCATRLTPEQPNILVDDAGHARITDFGLATVDHSLDSMRVVLDNQGHTARWTAPEILTEQGTYSKQSDIFSLAMVMIEVRHGC